MSFKLLASDLPAPYRAALWDATRDTWGLPGKPCRGYYALTVYVPEERPGLLDRYRKAAARHNCSVMAYVAGSDVACDSGFDLFIPETQVVSTGPGREATLLNHRVRCCMRRVKAGSSVGLDHAHGRLVLRSSPPGRLVGYYLYPRSSMATKTPLRLANSVGVIDAGYRGDIQAAVDMREGTPRLSYTATEGQRLVQICPPSLADPIYVHVTTDESELGKTERGTGGFGSTGSAGAKQ